MIKGWFRDVLNAPRNGHLPIRVQKSNDTNETILTESTATRFHRLQICVRCVQMQVIRTRSATDRNHRFAAIHPHLYKQQGRLIKWQSPICSAFCRRGNSRFSSHFNVFKDSLWHGLGQNLSKPRTGL